MPVRLILPNVPGEAVDASKQFTNIDDEVFEFSWDGIKHTVKSKETVNLPKYLANYASYHLARKIIKREAKAKAKAAKIDIQKGSYQTRNPAAEEELQREMLKLNFKVEKEVEKEEKKEEEEKGFKCPKCDFIAKSEFGLKTHIRAKHK